jgi:CDP-glycerol glycerophosphotransferase (TagB/SpsB family)
MSEEIIISSYDLKDNMLTVLFKEAEFINQQTLKVELVESDSNSSSEYWVELKRLENQYGFTFDLNQFPFQAVNKTIVDIYVYKKEDQPVRLKKLVPNLKEHALKYFQTPFHIDDKHISVLHLTTKDELSILYGRKAPVYQSFCTFISDNIYMDAINVKDCNFFLTSNHINFSEIEDFYFAIKERKSNDESEILEHKILLSHTVSLDLSKENWSLGSRYDLFLNIKVGRVIQRLRVFINEDYCQSKFFNLVSIDEGKDVLPYVSTKGEISFVGVNQWLYEYEIRTIDILYYDKVLLKNNILSFYFNETNLIEVIGYHKCKLEIQNLENSNSFLIHSNSYIIENNSLVINLKKVLTSFDFKMNEKWEFYLKIMNEENGLFQLFKIKKQSTLIENNNERYLYSIQLEENLTANLYHTTTNDLAILFSDKSTYLNLTYPTVESKICIHDLYFDHNRVECKLNDIDYNKIEMIKVTLKERNSKETWVMELLPSMVLEQGKLEINLTNFFETYQYSKTRWDMYLDVAHENMIESGKIGCFYDELQPKYFRYFSPIASRGNTVFSPYLTVYNELSFIINDKHVIDNERISAEILLTNFNMKNTKIVGTVEVDVPDVNAFNIHSIMMKYRGKADEVIEYTIPVNARGSNYSKKIVSFKIDVSKYEFQSFYWDLYLLIEIYGETYSVKIKNPTKKIKRKIAKKITKLSFTFDNGYFIYPYISTVNTLALTYREKPSYESIAYKIKENLAYYTYRLLKKYFERKDIWLAFEKFSEGAQDNGYYFFKYCYDNNKKKDFYYIIKKDSADFENVSHMKDKVIEFMSFKYMLYMYAAKLLISSESKGHAYDIRIQKGRLKYLLSKKKHVFLQHGVIALKRVDYVFKKTKNNAVNLFITSSDYEKNIIKKYFNYEDDEIITTGLCRWDVLKDSSGDNKEIFVMPTWRTWMDDLPEDQFIETDYYKNYVGFFRSEKLKEILEKKNIKLSFYIHPMFKSYIDSFNSDNKNFKIYQYGEEKVNKLLMNSSMLVTDYSSVAWEMFYQKKPVVFFQFDYEKYNAFQGSYLDMEKELFGDRALDIETLVKYIENYIDRDFKEKEEFGALRSKYFKYIDNKNSERTYKAIRAYLKDEK